MTLVATCAVLALLLASVAPHGNLGELTVEPDRMRFHEPLGVCV